MKTVSQLDAAGYFIGEVQAEPSPREPGNFLFPRGSIDVPPPQTPLGKVARWVANEWVFVDPPQEQPDEQSSDPRQQILQAIADIERQTLMNRTVREDLLDRYTEKAMAVYGVSREAAIAGMYASNIAYRRIKDIDDQVTGLRVRLAGLPG